MKGSDKLSRRRESASCPVPFTSLITPDATTGGALHISDLHCQTNDTLQHLALFKEEIRDATKDSF